MRPTSDKDIGTGDTSDNRGRVIKKQFMSFTGESTVSIKTMSAGSSAYW